MPEEAQSTDQQSSQKEAPVRTPHKINLIHILIGVIIGVVLLGTGFGIYFLTQSKSEPTNEPNQVSTPSAQQATPSAKETTQAEKESQKTNETQSKEETDNWKTYTGKYIKVTLKYPPNWEVNEVDGADTGEGKENTKISLNEAATDRNLSITENFLGGFAGLTQTSEKNITVGGVQTKKTYFVNEDETDTQMHIQFSKNGKDYYIIGSWDAEDAGADEIVDQILTTLKFLE